MGLLLERLKEKKLLVGDGAWGTMLQNSGLKVGECPEEWNVTHAREVRNIASLYARAGADMVLTNTFGGSFFKLKKYSLEARTRELNEAGARLSIEGAAGEGAPGCLVAASVGPTGEFLAPLGVVTEEEMEAVFTEQISALLEGGVRIIVIETMTAIEEAVCAVRAAKKLDSSIDVAATMTFDPVPGGFKTMMGVDCAGAVRELTAAGVDLLGSNCGNGIDQMIPITREIRRYTELPILIQSNAGSPELINGRTVFRQTPEYMAERVRELAAAGADIVGGCCGTTPDHIAAIRKAVDSL
ncbi:Bifunctional homocysteine S-methyltransferase/5,10-methylenetetrahydrofolate reductase [subsurface metagenome]